MYMQHSPLYKIKLPTPPFHVCVSFFVCLITGKMWEDTFQAVNMGFIKGICFWIKWGYYYHIISHTYVCVFICMLL